MLSTPATVAVTGANGFVGARVCEVLAGRGVPVRAIVRRAGTAPSVAGVTEVVGDFTDATFASEVVAGVSSVVTTVHPMGSDRAAQHRIGVEGTSVIARAAAAAGVERFIHISTAAVYDRSPQAGDVDESSALVGDDGGDYEVTKRDADDALASIDGMTRVLLRPPAILGPGPTSTWNTLRPAAIRDHEKARHAKPDQTFPWVHVNDLAALAADLADGTVPAGDAASGGPVSGACTPVNVAAPRATVREYYEAVTGALGLEPVWDDGPAWTGRLVADRAGGWGWTPDVDLEQALSEIGDSLRSRP